MADIQKATIRANGVALPLDRNALVLEKLTKVFQPLAGQEMCEGLRVQDEQLVKVAQAERIDYPQVEAS